MKAPSSRFIIGLPVIATVLFSAATPPTSAAPVLDAQGKKVVDQLTYILNKRIKKPNGDKINLVIVPTARSGQGYFQEIRMSGAPAQLKKKLRVTDFALDARNVRIDLDALWKERKVRTLASTTSLRATITEDDLTDMLAKGKHTNTMGIKIKFLGDKIRVTGNIDYALINGPVDGIAQLQMMPGHKVNLNILSMKLRGVELPGFVKDQFANRLNPIIDYQDLPFNPPFKGVKVVGNKAFLST